MLKILKQQNAQAVMGEYALIFFMIVAAMTAITIYFRRAVQARIFSARNTMLNVVINRTRGYYGDAVYNTLQIAYEPYYMNTVTTVVHTLDTETNLLPGATTGISRKTSDEFTQTRTRSETAPPRDAN
jgi:hypothetical protein